MRASRLGRNSLAFWTAFLSTALLFARPAAAADRIWKAGGGSANASNAANWIGGVAPASGDHVIFGSTGAASYCAWDLGVAVSSVDFAGTFSSSVVLTADLVSSGAVTAAAGAAAVLDLRGRRLSVGSSLTADGLSVVSSAAGSSVTFTGASYGVVSKAGGPLHVENLFLNLPASSSLTVTAGLIVDGSFTLANGSATLSGLRFDLKRDLFLGGSLDLQTSTLSLCGSSPQSLQPYAGGGTPSITSLGALYVQNPSTVTLPGVDVAVFVATVPAASVDFADTSRVYGVRTLSVAGGGAASRVRLVSASPGTPVHISASSATVDLAYVQDVDATSGPNILATHSVDGGGNAGWSILIGGGSFVWRYGGGSALASNGANWAGGVAPSTSDFVTFASSTPASPCQWDLAQAISSLTVTGSFAAAITLNTDMTVSSGAALAAPGASLDLNGRTLHLGGDLVALPGAVAGVAGSTVSFEGAGPARIASPSGAAVTLPAVSLAKASGAALTALAPLAIVRDFTVQSGTFSAGPFRHDIGGSLSVVGNYFDAAASTIALSGSGRQSALFNSASAVDGIGALYAQSPSTTTLGAWKVGVFVATTPSSNLVFSVGSSSFTASTFTVNGQSPATRIGLAGPAALAVGASADARYAYVSGLNASSGLNIPAKFSLDGGGNANWTITNVGGNVRVWSHGGADSLASNGANWTGGVAPGAGDYVVFGATATGAPCAWDLSVLLSSLTIRAPYAAVVTLSTTLAVSEGLRLDAPSGGLDPAGNRVLDGGDWQVLPGAFAGGVAASTVNFGGSLPSSLLSLGAGPLSFGRLEFAKNAGASARVLSDLSVAGPLETLGGSVDAGSGRIDAKGDVMIDGGAFDVTRSTLAFSGASPQKTSGNGAGTITSIAAIYVQNPTTTTILDVQAGVFVDTQPGSSVAFDTTGGSPTFGAFTVSGQSTGTRVSLLSAVPGTAKPLKVTGSASVDYAFIRDLNASGGQNIAAAHSIDGGNNTNWSISSVGGVRHVWKYGGGSALASNAANWTTGVVPSTGDFVLFGATTPNSPCTWDLTVALASVSVSGAYASTVTLSADMSVTQGVRFDAPAGHVDLAGHAVQDAGDWTLGAASIVSTVQGSSAVFVGAAPSRISSLGQGLVGFQGFVSSKTAGASVTALTDLVFDGDFIIVSGTFSAPGRVISLHHDVVSNGGYFDLRASTLVFSSLTNPQSVRGNGLGTATQAAGIDVQTTFDVTLPDLSMDVFVATRAGASILLASQSAPFRAAAVKIDGGSPSTRVRLQSAVPGTAAKLQVTSTASVVNASIKDSDASWGIPLIAVNSLDLGNNSSWTFVTNGSGIQAAFFLNVFVASASMNWYSSGFGAGQTYLAQFSTGPFPNSFAGNLSSTTLATSATFFGLVPATPYYAQVSTGGVQGPFTNVGSTTTLPALPTAAAAAAVYASSLTATWGPNGDPPGTTFVLSLSTDGFATISTSSRTLSTTATVAGLASNATYFLGVAADNNAGAVALPGAFVATVTAVSPPGVGAGAAVTSATVSASWTSADYAGTYYDAQISTDGYGTLVSSTRTTSLSALFSSLTPSTTYQLRVRALSNAGVPTAFVELATATTLLNSPGPAAVPFAVGLSSVSVSWTSGGNGAGTVYVADVSTDAFASLVFSSSTKSLSALFGTGGAGPALAADTTYYARVLATSGGNQSGYFQAGSTATLPAAPSAAAAFDVETASGVWSWSSGGNSTGTFYESELSTNSFTTLVQSSTATGASALFAGLTPNTTYQFRVRTLGYGGWITGYAGAASSATMPSAPGSVAYSVFVTSVHASWTDADPAPLRFAAEASSDAFATITASSVTANAFADVTGLAANTTYYLRVRALGVSGVSASTPPFVAATLALPPASPAFAASNATQVSVSWASGGNPGGTLYRADLSTDNFATLAQSSSTAGLTAAFSGLASDTTHFLRVSALNVAGAPSAFATPAGSTTTAVAAPAALPLSGVGASNAAANWGASTNGPGTLYEAQATTGTFPVFSLSTRTTSLSYNFTGLGANTTYSFQVRAIGRGGLLTSFVSLGTTATLLVTPGVPAQPFTTVGVSSAVVSWTSGGNGAGVSYDADLSTDNFVTVSLTSVTANLSAAFGLGGLGAPLASDATFYFRVRADGGSSQSAYVALGSTDTYPALPASLSVSAGTSTLTLAWSANGNGATSLYQAQISSNSFATVLASVQSTATPASFSALQADATYQLRVQALGLGRQGPTGFVSLSTWTTPALPGSVAAAASGVSSVTVTWTSPNPPGTPYLVQITSTSFPQLYASSVTSAVSAAFAGLPANTTFFAQVEALAPDGTGPGFVAAAATATPAAAPPSMAPAGLATTTGTWTWSIGANGPSIYRVDVSTLPGFVPVWQTTTISVSSAAGASVLFAGLQANTTQFARVRVEGWGGPSAYTASPASATAAGAPVAQPPGAVTLNSVTAAWGAGVNAPPPGTSYQADASTDGFLTVNATVNTANLNALFAGLSANTAYQFRVRAMGFTGPSAYTALPSTSTLPAPPAAGGFAAVGVSSVAVSWGSGGNAAGTVYQADVSTDGFATFVVSSFTANLGASFGTGGAGTLAPDTTYQFRVAATSGSALSPETALGSTATLAAAPLSPAAAALSTGSVSLSWAANGNPADASYLVQLSTDSFATLSAAATVQAAFGAFGGLNPDTTYYLQARALGRDGRPTASVSASTATFALAPAAPAAAMTTTSAQLSWTSADPASTVFDAQLSTDSFATLSQSSRTAGTSASFAGLVPDTTYFLRVRALGLDGPTSYAAAAASATLAAAPASVSAAVLGASAASESWSANGNPPGAVYEADVSTGAAFASLTQSSFTANTSAVFAGLGANTTYFLRVSAVNVGGGLSAYVSAGSTTTAVAAPLSAPLVSVGTGAIVAAWGANGDAPGTYFDAEISTDSFATFNAVARTTAASAGFGGLLSNAAYQLQVRAVGNDGTLTAFVALPSTTTRLVSPVAGPFSGVGTSSVAASWASGGNGAGTVYRADVSTDGFATLVASSFTANLSALFGAGGAGTLQPDTSYQFRVAATSGAAFSAFGALGSTVTLAVDPAAPAASASSTSTLTLAWSGGGNPSDTQYQAQASTDAFATVSQSSAVRAATAVLAGLAADTTYYLRVRAVGRGGTANAFVAAPATATVAAAPAAPAAALYLSSATLTWSSGGDPATTVFDAQLSTDSFATLVQSSQPRGGAASFAALTPNTTYFLRVRALGLLGPTAFAAAAAAPTLPAAPAGAAAAALGVSSVSVSWSSGGDPAGTSYGAELSTDNFATLSQSSVTAGLSAAFAGLQANGTCYLRVRALGWAGAPSAYASAGSTTTPVALPAAAPLVSVGSGSVVAAWASGGNAAGTLYDAQLSTDAFATVSQAARLAALQASFGGLLSNTNYFLRVRAVGNDGTLTPFTALPSTTTALLPPGTAAAPFPAVGVSSLTVAWTTGGNGPGTVYRVQLSTDAFATLVASSDTQNVAALFGSGGAGTLAVNTLYAARVLAVNGPNQSPLVPLGSTSTLALAPSGTFVVSVTSQTVSLGWSPNGNPQPGTSYQLDRDVSPAFSAPATVTVSTSAALAAGLAMNTTYYFRVRAVSAAGAPTAYDAAVSTSTLPPAPGQPGTPVPATLGVSSISWTWTPAALAAGYKLYSDTAATSLLNQQSSAAFVESGLGPNASAFLVVVGINGSGPGPQSVPALGWTFAVPPTGTAAPSVFATSATLTWGLNGNPAYTGAQVQRSLDGATYAAVGATVAAASFTDQNLLGCTTYYYRVRNFDGAGRATAFDAAVSFQTQASTPLPPTGLAAQPAAGFRVALSWAPSPSADATSYALYFDGGTGAVNFAAPYASFPSSATSFLTPPLSSSAAYTFVLRATNRCGVEEKNTATRAQSPALVSPAAVTAGVAAPPGGRHVSGNRVTLAAAQTTGPLTNLSAVRFQYRATGAGAWLDVPAAVAAHPNPAVAAPYYAQWDVSALAPGPYDLRAIAYDLSGSSDPAPAAATVVVDPAAPDLSENDVGGGRSRRDQAVYSTVDNAVVAGGLQPSDPLARLVLPAGALGTSTATLSLVSDPDLTGVSTAAVGAAGVGLYASVTLSNAQTVLSGGRTATLTLSYPDANNDGIVDGTGISAARLRFYSYNAISNSWQQDLTTTFDPASRTVSGATPHFSLFGVFAAAPAASTLDAVRVYPVPFRPNGPNPDQGRPYSAGVAGTGIFFDNLPPGARIQVYSVDGRLVADLSAAAGGTYQWDARNGAGRDAATGGYFAVITAPGLRSAVKRLSIIR